jgi:thiamine transporter ThiT
MIAFAVGAFVGCFAAMVTLAEITMPNKLVRYVVAFIAGALLAVILGFFLNWVAGLFHHIG